MSHTCQLKMPNQDNLFEHVKTNARHATSMVTHGEAQGGSVAICGAGPSLTQASGFDALNRTDEVWACNSALPFLADRGNRISHAFTIDMGQAMLNDWKILPDVTYLIASSVHPSLVKHLQKPKRKIRWFHSYLGIPDPPDWNASPCPWKLPAKKLSFTGTSYEHHLYTTLYPTSVMTGHGMNSVPRAICLALAMGFSNITVYGADCGVSGHDEMPEMGNQDEYNAWLSRLSIYADGTTASLWGEGASMMEAVIDGKRWHTRPDMAISAVHLLELQEAYPGRITIVGDTLTNALRGKDKDFMSRLPQLSAVGEVTNLRTERVA